MYDLAVIGAGPAGIAMVSEARAAGIPASRILVLEKAPEHSFTLKRFYPVSKSVTATYKGREAVCTGVMCIVDTSKDEALSYLDRSIVATGVAVHYGETVRRIRHAGQGGEFILQADQHAYTARTVVIAIGILGKPNRPDYPVPSSLRSRVVFELSEPVSAPSTVLVVGGGDSASEYCQFLVQDGHRVTLSYRRREFARMNDINRASLAALAGRGQVELLLGSDVTGLADDAGRPSVRFAGEVVPRTFDVVVYALGGTTPHGFLRAAGIAVEGGAPRLGAGGESSIPGLFLIGDLSAGAKGGSLIWAFNSANTAMRQLCRDYLECQVGGAGT